MGLAHVMANNDVANTEATYLEIIFRPPDGYSKPNYYYYYGKLMSEPNLNTQRTSTVEFRSGAEA